jgi:hypothetical protein
LIDGTEFDSSYKRNEPASFQVNRVIKGWIEALQMMKPGSKYQLFIPASLGYGERGAGQTIGPNSTLIFEVELLSIAAPSPTPSIAPGVPAVPSPGTSPVSKPLPTLAPGASPAISVAAKPEANPSPTPTVPRRPSSSASATPK